jgi:hypothetical protein
MLSSLYKIVSICNCNCTYFILDKIFIKKYETNSYIRKFFILLFVFYLLYIIDDILINHKNYIFLFLYLCIIIYFNLDVKHSVYILYFIEVIKIYIFK